MGKIFVVLELSTESGPGSFPSIRVHAFKTKEGLEKFKAEWHDEQKQCDRQYDEQFDCWRKGGWSYELDIHETEIS